MENPPNLSFPEATSVFSDLNHEDVRQELLNAFPFHQPNQITSDSNYQQAESSTSELAVFKPQDYIDGGKIFNGQLKYPFHSSDEIWSNRTDPFYFDGSEANTSFNLQENFIGRPLGSDFLEDPSKTYVENLLELKENHGKRNILDDSYVKSLYMFNTEKGGNYYTEQIRKEHEQLALHTREERNRKRKMLQEADYTRDFPQGIFNHVPRSVARLNLPPSAYNHHKFYRQSVMDRLFQPPPPPPIIIQQMAPVAQPQGPPPAPPGGPSGGPTGGGGGPTGGGPTGGGGGGGPSGGGPAPAPPVPLPQPGGPSGGPTPQPLPRPNPPTGP